MENLSNGTYQSINQRITAQEYKTRPIADAILKTNYFNKVLDKLETVNEDVLSTNDITYKIKGTNTIVFIEVKERTCTSMQYKTDVLDTKKIVSLQKKVDDARLKGLNAKAFYLALFPKSSQAIMYNVADLKIDGRVSTYYSKKLTFVNSSPTIAKQQYEFAKTEGHLFDYKK